MVPSMPMSTATFTACGRRKSKNRIRAWKGAAGTPAAPFVRRKEGNIMLDFAKTLKPDEPLIHPTCVVKNCEFGAYVELGDHCVAEETRFGDYTYLFGSNDVIYAALGKFNSIATGVRINPVNHPMRARAAAHHLTYRAAHYGLGEDDSFIIEWRRSRPVVTGNDVWLGHNAVIMGGVTLGDGAVAGAGAVVTHDVAP